MPVFLRWILFEMIVKRVLQHPRVRGHVDDRLVPMMSQYSNRFGRRFPPAVAGGARFMRRRPRLSCCSGCFLMIAVVVLGVLLLVALSRAVL